MYFLYFFTYSNIFFVYEAYHTKDNLSLAFNSKFHSVEVGTKKAYVS